MKTNRIQILCRILKTDLVYEASDGTLTAFFDILSQSPLMQSDGLRRILREGCEMQKAPFIHFDEHNCYFAGIKTSEGHLYMGPMCHHELKGRALSLMYKSYGMNLHPHAVLIRVLWRWYQNLRAFLKLSVLRYLTAVPVSPFGPFPAGRTYPGLSMSPLSFGIFHSLP